MTTSHPHPHYQYYKNGKCRCDDCTAENRKYETERQRIRKRPDSKWDNPLVDAQPTIEHLEFLARNGISLKMISEKTGLSRASIQYVRVGRRGKVLKNTEDKILALGTHMFESRDKRAIIAYKKRLAR
jgi:hypothetical protein